MVDSGATNSVIMMGQMTPEPKMSGNHIWSKTASGHTTKEYFTVPLTCEDEFGTTFKHCFLMSPSCPVNLCAQDLICKLGLSLVGGPDGLKILQNVKQSNITMASLDNSLLYVYQWTLTDKKTK